MYRAVRAPPQEAAVLLISELEMSPIKQLKFSFSTLDHFQIVEYYRYVHSHRG